MQIQRPSEPRLLAILCLAIGSFLASTLLSQVAEGKLHGSTRAILDDAVPSIEHLAVLRTELFREELLLRRFAAAATADRPPLRIELAAAQSAIRREEAAYEVVPPLVGERPLTVELRHQLGETDRVFDAALGLAAGDEKNGELLKRVETAFDGAQARALALLDLEAAKAAAFTRAIELAHARTRLISYLLDAVAALLTAVLAVMAWRAVRYYMDHQDAHALELDRFAGRVAHDIINPLSAVSLALGLLKRGMPAAELIPRAESSLKRADDIVEALLHFARAGGAHAEPGAHCLVRAVLEGVLADAAERARARGISLSLDVSEELAAACHAGVLASIAGNLVANAIKYIGSGAAPRRVSIRASGKKHSVRIEIEDNGIGISPALRQQIFLPFVRGAATDQPGIGLGLATAKRLCEAHGGQIGMSSSEGHGSTFWFELPRAQVRIEPQKVLPPAA